jgi:predicted nucleic acid-binding protein
VRLLDASVWAALALPDDEYHAAAGALVDSGESIMALDLTLFEVANVVAVKAKKPRRAQRLSRLIVKRCGDRVLRVDLDLGDAAIDVAFTHGLTAYDAAYVAAARRYGWTLVSTDIRDLVSKGLAVTPDAAVYP